MSPSSRTRPRWLGAALVLGSAVLFSFSGILTKAIVPPNGDLLGAFDIVHAVVMIARINDVPVPHHLPA